MSFTQLTAFHGRQPVVKDMYEKPLHTTAVTDIFILTALMLALLRKMAGAIEPPTLQTRYNKAAVEWWLITISAYGTRQQTG